jgi:hypothetical protein
MWWWKTWESVILKENLLNQPHDLLSLMPVGANYTSSNANPLRNPPQPLQGPRVQPTEILPRVHNLIAWKSPSLRSPPPRPESEDPLRVRQRMGRGKVPFYGHLPQDQKVKTLFIHSCHDYIISQTVTMNC